MENQDVKGQDGKYQDERPHDREKKLSRREIAYANYLLENLTPTEAARKAGFAESVAHGRVHEWIGETRITSKKPALFDYFQKKLKEKLRLHDINIDNILEEFKLIGFSSIHHFIDFPKREDLVDGKMNDLRARRLLGIARKKELDELQEYEEERDEVGLNIYKPGATIKLKCFEDIPRQLLPAIAEINETREGIKIKLHNKLDALDKLAKYLKLYEDAKSREEEAIHVKEVNVIVNGSRSPLLAELFGPGNQPEKPQEGEGS